MNDYIGHLDQINHLRFGVDIAAKATILFFAAMVASRLLARASAAVRHRIWCLTFCGVLLLPVLPFVVPEWTIAVLPGEPAVSGQVASGAEVSADADVRQLGWQDGEEGSAFEGVDLAASAYGGSANEAARASENGAHAPVGLLIWLVGAILLSLPLMAGIIHALLLQRTARRVYDADWLRLAEDAACVLRVRSPVRLLVAAGDTIPVTWGVLRPTVLLPAASDQWNEERRRLVLLHEFAHIKRLDLPWQWLARLACVLCWFHPLAWYALHRLRIEREQACDDCVIRAGEKASSYATELVSIAESYWTPQIASGLAMARSSKLEGRVSALFDQSRSHSPLGRRAGWGMLAGVVVLAGMVAAVRPVAGSAQALQAPSRPSPMATDTLTEASEPAAQASVQGSPSASLSEEEKEAFTIRSLQAIGWALHNYADANDDPVNQPAAKTLVTLLVTPSGAPFRDERGFAVSHFAFARGSDQSPRDRDDGAFPLVGAEKLAILDIKDGTSNTLGVGQIHDQLGPWIAAGSSTARRALHPKAKPQEPTFGSQYEGCAYFATCDAAPFFLDMASTDRDVLTKVATRSGRELVQYSELSRYRKVSNWQKSREE